MYAKFINSVIIIFIRLSNLRTAQSLNFWKCWIFSTCSIKTEVNKCKIDHVESVIYLYWVPNINCLHQRLSQHQNTLRKILNLQEAVMFFHSLPLWRNCFRFNVFSREGRKTRQYSQSSLCFPCFYLFCCPASPWGAPISQKYMGKNRKKLEIFFFPGNDL